MSRRLVTFTLAGARYGVDILLVREAMRGQARTSVPLAAPSVAGLVNLRGKVVLAVDLRNRLGLAPLPADREAMEIVVQVDGELTSLLVDEVNDVLDVDGRDIEAPPGTLPASMRDLILGVYQLESSLVLALDLAAATSTSTGSSPPDLRQPTGRTP